ncbi:MAG: class I SAM-dependent methyltransferase [Deltaproteobacteria bacterium]|nr:class I SAM-dependent methyltransferase [Deltaproteobacteria bacterium]
MVSNYSITAKIYDPLLYFFIKPIRIAILTKLLNHKDKVILDLCCGTGNQIKLLAKHGFTNLHCLDVSASMLEIAKKSDYPIHIYNEDATKTHFDDESFDIVIISFAIHEKDKATQQNLINETHRLLKKDGFLLVVDFAFDGRTTILSKIAIRFIERLAGGEHYINFNAYIQNNGLSGVIPSNKFTLLKNNRNLFKSVSVSLYRKM